MGRTLIVEDEPDLARFLELEFRHEGHDVVRASSGRAALEIAASEAIDLVILDLGLPDLHGIEVCRRLRAGGVDVPIIMLTALGEVGDRVAGLDAGADDYLTKPFRIEELLARIRAVRRRLGRTDPRRERDEVRVGPLRLSPARRQAWHGDRALALTRREFDLLNYLMANANLVCTRDQILDAVWGMATDANTNVVDVYVRYLREKVDVPAGTRLIRTVRGVGYTLADREG